MNYIQCRLGDVAEIIMSSIDKKSKPNEKTVRLCNFTDVYHNWAITKDKYDTFMIATASDNAIEKLTLKKGYVAFTKDSETRDDIGIPTYIADDFDDVVLGYHCALVKPNKHKLSGEYLNAFMNSDYIKKYFELNATGSGMRFTLAIQTLEDMPLILPDLSEQKRIAKVLTDIDSKIAVNKKINKELEVMAKELYDYWFVQFDFPGVDGKPYKSSGGKMVYNEVLKREIPEGWEVKKLENVMNVNRGGSPRPIDDYISDKGLHWLKISDATASSSPFILNTKEYIKESGLKKTVMMKADSIVLSNSATPGMPRILNIDTCIHDGWLYFSKTELSNEFLYLFFLKMRENIVKLANGSIFLNLKTDVVKDFKMVLPTKSILKQFDDVIKPIFSQMLNLEKEQVRLSKMRDEILPMLMNGQVSVK